MIPFDRRPASEAPLDKGEPVAPARQGTLPPPAWAGGDSSVKVAVAQRALVRRAESRAGEAWLRARIAEARGAEDGPRLREACMTLARWLGSRDRDLDEAVQLATIALSLGEDTELRREMTAWLESVGASARAAAALKPVASMADVDSHEASYVLVRTGLLKARAGEPAGAAAAFEAALSIDAADPLPAELLGALSAWPDAPVPLSAAVEAYIEAARRRAALAQDEAQLENLWRAFALDPASDAVSEAVVQALEARRRSTAASEVRRAQGRALLALDPGSAYAARERWRSVALSADRSERSSLELFGEALDLGLDRCIEGVDAEAFDAILLEVGIFDAIAARLEARSARVENPAAQAKSLVALGVLCRGPLDDPARAESAFATALAADPNGTAAIMALRAGGSERSPSGPLEPKARELTGPATRRQVSGPSPEFRTSIARALVAASLGDSVVAQAAALERLVSICSPAVAPVLLAVAADRYATAGEREAGRRAAERATLADTTSVRAITALADAVVDARDRAAVAALERAISMVGPRAPWCFALADALDALGEFDLAAKWSERCVGLRPGDREATTRWLVRLSAARASSRLGDALAWLLSQPQPALWVAAPFAQALSDLAILDPNRAMIVARRTLDVLGPESAVLREAMLEVARGASDETFAAAILERWLSCGATGADRPHLYATLAELRHRLGDEESAMRVVARAFREGATTSAVDGLLDSPPGLAATPDALLWRLEATARRLSSTNVRDSAAAAWREFGGALWDLAADRASAIAAWTCAARTDGRSQAYATLVMDIVAFADSEFAFDTVERMVDEEADDGLAGSIAAGAARAALSLGALTTAFDFASRAIARSPDRADALEIAEWSATQPSVQDELSALYEIVATRALGRFGRRAAHYRAARLFERRSEHRLALKHAAQAFYAVPSEGSSFQLLARAAERAGDRAHAVQTVEQVAESAERSHTRTAWLLRAASIAGDGAEGTRRKVDVLLRAAVSTPSVPVVALLADSAKDFLGLCPEERPELEMRLRRAGNAITGRVGGPDGARVAIAFAQMSLDLFSDADSAMASVERAFACDADVDEFAALVPGASALGTPEGARERLTKLIEAAELANANVGIPALKLFGAVAAAFADGELEARVAIAIALRAPDDDATVICADAAAKASPELEARLARKVPVDRRREALVAVARGRFAQGAAAEAASLFERAIELADTSSRAALEQELRAAWDAAGRSVDIEARVQLEAACETTSPAARADHWTEIAGRRESRGDKSGAVRALIEACKLDPDPLERWSALERLAEASGEDSVRVAALEAIAMRVGSRGRVAVFKRLARVHEQRNDLDGAERAWQRVLALDSEDEEADHAVEAAIAERGRYEDLADHLGRRADRLTGQTEKKEVLRALRLRRAAILEQRLGRIEEACDELTRLLTDWPNSAGALRYLADLLERKNEHVLAAPLWERAAALESDPAGRDELELRAGRAALAAGDPRAAVAHVARINSTRPAHRTALELRAEAARRAGLDEELGQALEALAASEGSDGSTRSELLLEAAQAAARAGDQRGAQARAQRAAEAAPERATPQLLARALEYRLRGAGAPDDARRTIEELGRIREPVEGPDAALRAFLMAEALDVVQGRGAALRELESARAQMGDHPLIALGMAERFAAMGEPSAAVDEYRLALRGSLLELRRAGSVALHAADAGFLSDRYQDVAHFLDLAEADPDSRTQSRAMRGRLLERTAPPAVEAQPAADLGNDLRLEELKSAVAAASTPVARAHARLTLARFRLDGGDFAAAEPLLWEALADGLAEAGDLLAPLVASAADRGRDLVRLRRQQAVLEPGDVGRLELLRAAALADGHRVYARAIEHVLRAFDPGAGPLPPPPLYSQPEQVGILALLTRPSRDAAGEALAALWESAAHLFARDPDAYGIAGLERVVPGPTSAVSSVYEAALRLLDVPRIPLYLTGASTGVPAAHVAVLTSPSVLLGGDVDDENAALQFALGGGLSAALPHNVLRLGLSRPEGLALVDAMRAAFGPPEIGRRVDAHAARLAQSFWQNVPARTQRRLQELLGGGTFPDYADLVERGRQSGRRVGMFFAGDFAWAARQVIAEAPVELRSALSLANLRSACEEVPGLADLVTLAVSPEYAEARWHMVASNPPRGMLSSGRLRLF